MMTQDEAMVIGKLLDDVLPTIHPMQGALLVAKGYIVMNGKGTVNGKQQTSLPVVTKLGKSTLQDYIENLPDA